MQKNFKPIRIALSSIFFIAILISFSDIKANLPSWVHISTIYLQFIPSVLKFTTPGTILSVGFILVLIITLVGGRIYCSTICPLGVLQDIIIYIKRKTTARQQFKFKKSLKALRYTILGLTILSFTFSGILFLNLLDPYAIFGRISSHIYQPFILFTNNLVAKTIPAIGMHSLEARPIHWASLSFAVGMLLLVLVMSVLRGRLYCNTICPVGTLLGLLSKISFFKIKISESSCTKCGKCQNVCKANCINIKTLEVDESRCINCFDCLPVCNEDAINYQHLPKAKLSNNATDSKRRFFLTASIAYLAAKTIPSSAQYNKNNHNVHFYDKGPTAPPGSKSFEHLKDKCIACHLCVSVCPTKVLQPSFLDYGITGMNLPKMDYSNNFCNYECKKCAEVCPTGAIIDLNLEEKKLTQIGKVNLLFRYCIVKSEGTACGSCSEHCPTQAVKMVSWRNGLTKPEIDSSICIGCGACEYACPVTDPHPAIYIVPNQVHVLAEKPITKKVDFEETDEFPF